MSGKQVFSKWMRLQEVLVTTLLGGIPTLALGPKLRNLLYRTIFARIGNSVYIQDGVEFLGTSGIEIGDGASIYKGVRISTRGQGNNRIYVGDGVSLERGVEIGAGENTLIHIDENTYIGCYTCIAGPGNIKIGKGCQIAAHTGIYANNHIFSDPMQYIRLQGVTRKGIVIEDDCWLGHGVTVLDGVTIGKGSVIGAGSVVTKDIPPYSVAVGIPARVIKSRKANELVSASRQFAMSPEM
jgi:galactoside O-acetyltransferase